MESRERTDAESREWRAVSGQMVTNVYLEQAYKGNIHLYATIDGVARRWVLRPSMPEYGHIAEIGIPNVPFDILKHLVEERI